MSMNQTDELRSELRRRAAQVPVGPVPERLLTRGTAYRRHSVVAVTVGATTALVAAALGAPALLDAGGSGANASYASQGALRQVVADWPTRGSLADRTEYLARARQWFAAGSDGVTPERVHILYAGDVGTYRLVVAAMVTRYPGGRYTSVRALGGPAGNGDALHQEIDVVSSGGFDQDTSLVLARLWEEGRATLVGVTTPGIESLQVSRAPHLRPDGTITRDWTGMPDTDPERGVFRSSIDRTAPAGTRVRAIEDGEVVDEVDLRSAFTGEVQADDRLRDLVAEAADGRRVGGLATELARLEAVALAPATITEVEIPWRFEASGRLGIGVIVRTSEGAAVEAAFSEDLAGDGVGTGSITRQWIVPAGEAGEEPRVWRSACRFLGWVPTGGPEVSFAEVVAGEDRVLPRTSTDGRPLVVGFSSVGHPTEEGCEFTGPVRLRLYDAEGRRSWTSERLPVGPQTGYPSLDTPSTVGDRVG